MVTGGASAVSSRRVELVFAPVEFMTIMISRRIAAIITLAKIEFPFHDSVMKVDHSDYECRLVDKATNNSNKQTVQNYPRPARIISATPCSNEGATAAEKENPKDLEKL